MFLFARNVFPSLPVVPWTDIVSEGAVRSEYESCGFPASVLTLIAFMAEFRFRNTNMLLSSSKKASDEDLEGG